jgi:hypothetical protein
MWSLSHLKSFYIKIDFKGPVFGISLITENAYVVDLLK